MAYEDVSIAEILKNIGSGPLAFRPSIPAPVSVKPPVPVPPVKAPPQTAANIESVARQNFIPPDPSLRSQGDEVGNEFATAPPDKTTEVSPPAETKPLTPAPEHRSIADIIKPIAPPPNRGLFGISGLDWASLAPGKLGDLFAAKAESVRENQPAFEIGGEKISRAQLGALKAVPEWAARYYLAGSGGEYKTEQEASLKAAEIQKQSPNAEVSVKQDPKTRMWGITTKYKTGGAGGVKYQKEGETESGLPVSYDNVKALRVVTLPDGSIIPYNESEHGKIKKTIEARPPGDLGAFEDWAKKTNTDISDPTKYKAQYQNYLANLGKTQATKIELVDKRAEAFAKTRVVNVFDTRETLPDGSPNPGYGSIYPLNLDDVEKANKAKPGTFLTGSNADKALNKHTFLTEMEGTIDDIRAILNRPTWKDFSAVQIGALSRVLQDAPLTDKKGGTVNYVINSKIFQSLSPDQQDFTIALFTAKESAMGMRQLLGGGQGSDLMRTAISATLPGMIIGSTGAMQAQLNAFTRMTKRLRAGIANPKLAEMKTPASELPSMSVNPIPPLQGAPQPKGGGETKVWRQQKDGTWKQE